MQVKSLKHVVELVRAGSFYQAARYSGLTVQGYTKMLDSLEHELGVKLAVRDRRGVRLTRVTTYMKNRLTSSWHAPKTRAPATSSVQTCSPTPRLQSCSGAYLAHTQNHYLG